AARAAVVVVMATQPYAGDVDRAKAGASPQMAGPFNATVAVLLGLWPFVLFDWRAGMVGLGLGAVAALALTVAARRLLGGRTGDVLGAVEQVFETGVLLGATLLLR
ncbi:MAG: adenosylcobinamide-GDP ribazoletransferase, partial [Caulobacteraceae bacterium]